MDHVYTNAHFGVMLVSGKYSEFSVNPLGIVSVLNVTMHFL